jgi:hypothetical protein
MRPKKYDEETKMISFRVPISRIKEVQDSVYELLAKSKVVAKVTKYAEVELKVVPAKPKWAVDAEERMKRDKL